MPMAANAKNPGMDNTAVKYLPPTNRVIAKKKKYQQKERKPLHEADPPCTTRTQVAP